VGNFSVHQNWCNSKPRLLTRKKRKGKIAKNVLNLPHFPTEPFNCYSKKCGLSFSTKHRSYISSAINGVNNGKFPNLLCRHYRILSRPPFPIKYTRVTNWKEDKDMTRPRNVCVWGYGLLNRRCRYKYLLIKNAKPHFILQNWLQGWHYDTYISSSKTTVPKGFVCREPCVLYSNIPCVLFKEFL